MADMDMRYKAEYKGLALGIEKTDYGWRPHVVYPNGQPKLGGCSPGGACEQELTSQRDYPYPPYLKLEEAKDKACHEATLRADGVEKSCAEAGIEWIEI